MRANARQVWLLVLGVGLFTSSGARAQGFTLERYEPPAAGSWMFGVVDPWYSSTRYLAAGLTLDYAHNPLLAGTFDNNGFHQITAVVEHQLVGHVDVAGSFLDRVQINASLPVVLLERGTPAFGVSPLSGAAVGDPRLGVMVRLWGQPERSVVSIHLGGYVWIPVGNNDQHAGDRTARGLPQVVLSGVAVDHLRWAFNGGVLIRAGSTLGFGPGNSSGTELQLGAALGYADQVKRFNVGPELLFGTVLVDGHAFQKYYSSLDLMVGGQYNIAKLVQVGLGLGFGLLGQLGEPDARVIFRVAYAPIRDLVKKRPDTDGDGVFDDEDACVKEPGIRTSDPKTNGCPDRDHDGIVDSEDVCPDQAPGAHPDAKAKGCPVKDDDGDGVPDAEDQCPKEASGEHPDPLHPGCPFKDEDGDGIPDAEDQCPGKAAGARPDPKRPGCPIGDTDGDGIMDDVDACPDKAGVPDPDPAKHGCPKIVVKTATVTGLQSVHFETNKWVLLPESFPILDDVAKVILARPDFKHIVVEGHADDTGTKAWNLRLSKHRAQAVAEYLVKKGVKRGRLDYIGYGDTRPVSPERTDEARAANRRVEIKIQ